VRPNGGVMYLGANEFQSSFFLSFSLSLDT
jgi:hypothetical protein